MIKKTILLLMFIQCLFLVSNVHAEKIRGYKRVTLDDIKTDAGGLNRAAKRLTKNKLKKMPKAHIGFKWQQGALKKNDFGTGAWRPQGITVIPTDAGNTFVAVSWYHRAKKGKRGARIAFVDITDLKANKFKYRFVLLVDNDGKTFKDMHVGGLVYLDGNLHVPDSRPGRKQIYVFPIKNIEEVTKKDRNKFFNYRYILRPDDRLTYQVPIKPSFLSYDPDMNGGKILVGTFCEKNCSDKARSLLWYTYRHGMPNTGSRDTSCYPFTHKMQGAVSFTASNNKVILLSTSFGKLKKSKLYIINNKDYYGCEGRREVDTSTTKKVTFPIGLEDLHYEKSSGNIWMLNEFAFNRYVWAVNREHYMVESGSDLNKQ